MESTSRCPRLRVEHVTDSSPQESSPCPLSSSRSTSIERPQTRRAMLASTFAGLQRFKQSWISIMILKAGVGMSQVIVLIVLLILSRYLPSPLPPHNVQTVSSSACPRPVLFQAWMGTSMGRLVLCWTASFWTCIRLRRTTRIEDGESGEPGTNNHSRSRGRRMRRAGPEDRPRTPTNRPKPAGNGTPTATPSPSLASSAFTVSTATLSTFSDQNCKGDSPGTIYTSRFGSSPSLDALTLYTAEKRPITEAIPLRPAFQLPDRPRPLHLTVNGASRPYPNDRSNPVPEHSALQAARELMNMSSPTEQQTRPGEAGWLKRADKAAELTSKAMGLLSAALFILGNVLVFYPSPVTNYDTCYQAAPLLWWGVMTVTGVGWFLIGQLFVVLVVVGIGGQAVVAILRRCGVLPPPPETATPRPPPPPPLSESELDQIPKVVYVPPPAQTPEIASAEPVPSSHGHSSHPSSATLNDILMRRTSTENARLPHPPIYLPSDKVTCAVCQENFVPPKEGSTIMLQAQSLRSLPCGHVYHADCIDRWLVDGNGNCPFCLAPARRQSTSADRPRRSPSGRSMLSRWSRSEQRG